MTWFGWIVVIASAYGIFVKVYSVDRPVKRANPTSALEAAIFVVLSMLYLCGYLFVGTGHL